MNNNAPTFGPLRYRTAIHQPSARAQRESALANPVEGQQKVHNKNKGLKFPS